MPDDLTLQYHRLTHTAALVGDYADHPERQKELLAWALKTVQAIATARGLQIEARQPEPMPRHISRELWPAQGERVNEDGLAERTEALVARLHDLLPPPAACGCRVTVEAGAGFASGELVRPEEQ